MALFDSPTKKCADKLRPLITDQSATALFMETFYAGSEVESTRAFGSRYLFLLWAVLTTLKKRSPEKVEIIAGAFERVLSGVSGSATLWTLPEFFPNPLEWQLINARMTLEGTPIASSQKLPFSFLVQLALPARMDSYRNALVEGMLDVAFFTIGMIIQTQVTEFTPPQAQNSPADQMAAHLKCLYAEWQAAEALGV